MSAAPAPPPTKHRPSRRPTGRRARRSARPAWSFDGFHRVEIVAPDAECAALLLEYASPVIPAELLAGATIVRLDPPRNDTGWVIELLAVVERWLDAAPLPGAKLFYGGRSYLIRSATHVARFVPATEPTTPAIR